MMDSALPTNALSTRPRRRRATPSHKPTVAFVETLENRTLLTVDLATFGNDGLGLQVEVVGDAAESIVIREQNDLIVVEGNSGAQTATIPASTLQSLRVFGGPGHDEIDLTQVTGTDFPSLFNVEVNPRAGRDRVVGSPLADTIVTEDDQTDTVRGGSGADQIVFDSLDIVRDASPQVLARGIPAFFEALQVAIDQQIFDEPVPLVGSYGSQAVLQEELVLPLDGWNWNTTTTRAAVEDHLIATLGLEASDGLIAEIEGQGDLGDSAITLTLSLGRDDYQLTDPGRYPEPYDRAFTGLEGDPNTSATTDRLALHLGNTRTKVSLDWSMEVTFGADGNGFYARLPEGLDPEITDLLTIELDATLREQAGQPGRVGTSGSLGHLSTHEIYDGDAKVNPDDPGLGSRFAATYEIDLSPEEGRATWNDLPTLDVEGAITSTVSRIDLDVIAGFAGPGDDSVFDLIYRADFEMGWDFIDADPENIVYRSEVQRVTGPVTHPFTLSFEGETTGPLNMLMSANQIERALEGLSGIGPEGSSALDDFEGVLVNELPFEGGFEITFVGLNAHRDVPLLEVNDTSRFTVTEVVAGSGWGETPQIRFDSVAFDVGFLFGGFITPIVQRVQQITAPLQPMVDLLQSPVPLLSMLGESLTFSRLFFGSGADSFLDAIATINALDIPDDGSGAIFVDLGSFQVRDPRLSPAVQLIGSPAETESTLSAVRRRGNSDPNAEEDPQVKTFIDDTVEKGNGLQFPILTDPNQTFALMLAAPADLFTYDLPQFGRSVTIERSYPIYPGINAKFFGSLGVEVDLDFGYDTHGIDLYRKFGDPLSILDGFYLMDRVGGVASAPDKPEIVFTAEVGVGIELGLPEIPYLAEVTLGVSGGIRGTLELDLADFDNDGDPANGQGDGRVRGSELKRLIDADPFYVFNASGSLVAFLRIGVDIVMFPRSIFEWVVFTWSYEPLNLTILEFAGAPRSLTAGSTGCDAEPELGYVSSNGTLHLNAGLPANDARYGVPFANPGEADNYTVSPVSYDEETGLETVEVRAEFVCGGVTREVTKTYDGVRRIEADSGPGDDRIQIGDVRSDFAIDAGAGNDRIDYDGRGRAWILGGAGNDTLDGSIGDDALAGGEGDDWLYGREGDDRLFSAEGDFTSPGGFLGGRTLRGDVLFGGEGNDQLWANGDGEVNLFGEDGDDILHWTYDGATRSDQWLDGGDGQDRLFVQFGPGDDRIELQPAVFDGWKIHDIGIDVQTVDAEPITVFVDGIETQELNMGRGADRVTFETGTTLPGDLDLSVDLGEVAAPDGDPDVVSILGTNGNDEITMDAQDSGVVRGGSVVDLNWAGISPRIYGGGASEDQLIVDAQAGHDILRALPNAADFSGLRVKLTGGDGNDLLIGGPGDDHLEAGAGDDTVLGGDGNDSIIGTNGNNLIEAGAGDDTIWGGHEDDRIRGQQGIDTYILNGTGDSEQILVEHFNTGVEDQLLVQRINSDLIRDELDIVMEVEGVSLQGLGGNDLIDASALDQEALDAVGIERMSLGGYFGRDTLIGSAGPDVLNGSFDDDTVHGGAGDDTIVGGTFLFGGNLDQSDGGGGFDRYLLQGSTGPDTVRLDRDNGFSNVRLQTGALSEHVDQIAGFEQIEIEGGIGNDSVDLRNLTGFDLNLMGNPQFVLDGGQGNDTLHGSGSHDTLISGPGDDLLTSPAGNNIFIVQGSGAKSISGGAGTDSVLVDKTASPESALVQVSDATLANMIMTTVEHHSDEIGQWELTLDVLTFQVEALEIRTGSGADAFQTDSLTLERFDSAGLTSLVLDGGAGDDRFEALSAAPETVYGRDGDDVINTNGNDLAWGGPGNDRLSAVQGGLDLGGPTLFGGDGDDRLIVQTLHASVSGGDGVDSLDHWVRFDDPANDLLDRIALYHDPGRNAIQSVRTELRDGSPIGHHDYAEIESLTVVQTFDSSDDATRHLGMIDASGLSKAALEALGLDGVTLIGGFGPDTLIGSGGHDLLVGHASFDSLGLDPNPDVIRGGPGNDTIVLGAGDDLAFGGAGHDVLQAIAGGERTPSGLDDLILGVYDPTLGAAAITWIDRSTGEIYGIDIILDTEEFHVSGSDGDDVLDFRGLDPLPGLSGVSLVGDAGDDSILGTDRADTLSGGDGDDTIEGSDGNDSILGEWGADTLLGGEGADTLRGGHGSDRIVAARGADLIVDLFGDNFIRAGDGSDTVTAGDGDDTIEGNRFPDLINAGHGNNVVDGGGDDDTITAGDGDDILRGQFGDDSINGGAGDDTLLGGNSRDTLIGGIGEDSIDGGNGFDSILGGSGDDTLINGRGRDTLDGGAGADTLKVNHFAASSITELARSGQGDHILRRRATPSGPVLDVDVLLVDALDMLLLSLNAGNDTLKVASDFNGLRTHVDGGAGTDLSEIPDEVADQFTLSNFED